MSTTWDKYIKIKPTIQKIIHQRPCNITCKFCKASAKKHSTIPWQLKVKFGKLKPEMRIWDFQVRLTTNFKKSTQGWKFSIPQLALISGLFTLLKHPGSSFLTNEATKTLLSCCLPPQEQVGLILKKSERIPVQISGVFWLFFYPDCNKVSKLLNIHSSHHHPQALFHFLGPPTKSLTPSLVCCKHPLLWQNIKTHIYLDRHFFSLSDLLHSTLHLSQLSRCMVLLVSSLPLPLHFCPFCPTIFSVAFFCFLSFTSREPVLLLWELQEMSLKWAKGLARG